MAAARAAGRDDLMIVTEDLGENVAIAMAKGELVMGLGAQRPYDQGVTEAKLGAPALIGKPGAAYVALPRPAGHPRQRRSTPGRRSTTRTPPADLAERPSAPVG